MGSQLTDVVCFSHAGSNSNTYIQMVTTVSNHTHQANIVWKYDHFKEYTNFFTEQENFMVILVVSIDIYWRKTKV